MPSIQTSRSKRGVETTPRPTGNAIEQLPGELLQAVQIGVEVLRLIEDLDDL
jgi:hypothetical protein